MELKDDGQLLGSATINVPPTEVTYSELDGKLGLTFIGYPKSPFWPVWQYMFGLLGAPESPELLTTVIPIAANLMS